MKAIWQMKSNYIICLAFLPCMEAVVSRWLHHELFIYVHNLALPRCLQQERSIFWNKYYNLLLKRAAARVSDSLCHQVLEYDYIIKLIVDHTKNINMQAKQTHINLYKPLYFSSSCNSTKYGYFYIAFQGFHQYGGFSCYISFRLPYRPLVAISAAGCHIGLWSMALGRYDSWRLEWQPFLDMEGDMKIVMF